MFMLVQHSLTLVKGRQIVISEEVQDKLYVWRQLAEDLTQAPTQLNKSEPFIPTWVFPIDDLETVTGLLCHDPTGQWSVLQSAFSPKTQKFLVSFETHQGIL